MLHLAKQSNLYKVLPMDTIYLVSTYRGLCSQQDLDLCVCPASRGGDFIIFLSPRGNF